MKCKYGKLKSPIRNPKTGAVRYCKIKIKTKKGKKMDRKRKSQEAHEIIYRRKKRKK